MLAYAYGDEDIEQHDVEKVVDGVGTDEADAVLYVALAVESETGGEVIVEKETQKISDGIGD